MYTDGKTVHYGYDEQIRLFELKEGGRIISYGYDALGRLSEIKRTDRYRQRMDMMPLETVHGKKKMAKGLRTSTISSTRW